MWNHMCAWRDHVVHHRMNANGFYLLPYVYSPETKQNNGKILGYGTRSNCYYLHTGCQLFTILLTLCTMGPCCHSGLVFQSPWLLHESFAPSSDADQLLNLFPAWRAGPSPISPQGWPHFPQGSGTFLLLHRLQCGLESYALHPNHSPPSPYPSHFRISLLTALQRDEPKWSRPKRSVHCQFRDQRMPDDMSVYFHFFSHQDYFLWNTPEISCLLSVDHYYLFRLIKRKSGIKASACVSRMSSAVGLE